MNIAEVVRAWRHHHEMTLQQASEQVGLTLDTYRRIERGAALSGETQARIYVWLFGPDPEP
jgi:transcriptional regulator with XRE-family HTH domain